MLNRMNFGINLAAGQMAGVRPDGQALFEAASEVGPDPLEGLATMLLPGVDTSELIRLVRDDLEENPPASEREAGMRVLGMILGSPEFQVH